MQRRNQKVIEESSSPRAGRQQVDLLKESARRLALAVGYRGAGTVEFLYQPAERTFAFLEVNTRLQVEHPVTELTTGVDLVALQLHVAAGGRLDGEPPQENGHAVEARLNAEDPDRDFAPAPGRISLLRLPTGPGLRIDTGVAENDTIPSDFDSMIAKIIAYGSDRDQALARLRRALEDVIVVIEGGTTNKSFILDLLARSEVTQGRPEWADTGWIDRERTRGGLVNHRNAGMALVAAGIDAYDEAEQQERWRFLATAYGGRPLAQHEVGRSSGWAWAARRTSWPWPRSDRTTTGSGWTTHRSRSSWSDWGSTPGRLIIEGRAHRVVTATHAATHLIEVDAAVHRITKDEGGAVRSPAPALVVSLPVTIGDEVRAGTPVAVLESMKMETVLAAPYAGRVREVLVATGGQVGAGEPLLTLEPLADAADVGSAKTEVQVELPEPSGPVDDEARALSALTDLRHLLLGFDVAPEHARRLVGEYRRLRARSGATDELLDAELGVLEVFADLSELARNRPHAGDGLPIGGEAVHSPREYLHSYLHSLDVDRAHLPEHFRAKLSRVLAHYGIDGLDRTVALEDAMFRVFLAQQNLGALASTLNGLMEPWLDEPAPRDGMALRSRDVLDRLVHATQLRSPAIGDLARSARHRWFEAPLTAASRELVYSRVREQLNLLNGGRGGDRYEQTIEELVASPEPLAGFLAERLEQGPTAVEPMLEVLARRHYREYHLHSTTSGSGADRPVITADYELDERPTHLISTVARIDELARVADLLDAEIAAAPAGHQSVLDLYLDWPEAPPDDASAVATLAEELSRLPFATRLRRIAVGVCAGLDPVRYVTFRPDGDGGVTEDGLIRGLHPMVGRRLNLWRLREFDITRLDSPPDVLLYRCVAHGNASDVRLVAMAQVRELDRAS